MMTLNLWLSPLALLWTLMIGADEWPGFGGPRADFTLPAAPLSLAWPDESGPRVLWSAAVGGGHSQVVVGGGVAFLHHELEGGRDRVVAFDAATGTVRWMIDEDAPAHPDQESYGGGTGPHATPLLLGDTLIVLGYGGRLRGIDVGDGSVRWRTDLVKELEATPVQFGFAASPVAWHGRALVAVGGKRVGLVAFDPKDGSHLWSSDPFEPSYVTPTRVRIGGNERIAVVTRDDIRLVDPSAGATVATIAHRKAGLTNFAISVWLDDREELLVSGQGTAGSRAIGIDAETGELAERWFARGPQLSHGTAARCGDLICASLGATLAAYDGSDGRVLWRKRGFPEANVLRVGEAGALILDERGKLSLARVGPGGIEVLASHPILSAKSWTAPTLVGTTLFARDRQRLVVLELGAKAGQCSLIGVSALEAPAAGAGETRVEVPESLLELYAGEYAYGGESRRVVRIGDALGFEGGDSWRALGEDSFRMADGRLVRFRVDEEGAISELRIVSGESEEAWERRPPVIVALDESQRERALGTYLGEADLRLEVFEEEGELRTRSSLYGRYRFRLRAESSTAFWVEPIDAPFGVPPTKLVLTIEEGAVTGARIFQRADTVVVRRQGPR